MKWNFCFPDKPQEYDFYPFALCNDLFEEASSSLFHTHWYRGCLRCFIFVEQCCRYEFHHIHSPDRFTPQIRVTLWHCCNVLSPFLFCAVILVSARTHIWNFHCGFNPLDWKWRWNGFLYTQMLCDADKGWCEQNTDQYNRIVYAACLVEEMLSQQSVKQQ